MFSRNGKLLLDIPDLSLCYLTILMTCQNGPDDHNDQGQAEGHGIVSPGNV
jgi:hypothetical protein